jgi:hypothetical protein
MGTISKFTFHSATTASGVGNEFTFSNLGADSTLFISLSNDSGSRVLNFEGKTSEMTTYVPIYCKTMSGSMSATSVSGSSNEIWYTNVAGLDSFRCNLGLTSGSFTAIGKLVL